MGDKGAPTDCLDVPQPRARGRSPPASLFTSGEGRSILAGFSEHPQGADLPPVGCGSHPLCFSKPLLRPSSAPKTGELAGCPSPARL